MPGPRDAARGADPTVTLGRHTLAAALVWHTVAEDSDLLEEVRDLASGDSGHGTAADLYVPRATAEIPQFALGASAEGLRAGQPSLAALLDLVLRDADGGTPDAAGAWRLDDGRYYVFLRRDGAILPDGDALFAREADARDHFLASLTPGGGPWHALHAPEAWSVAGAGTDTLEQVLGNALPPPRRVAVLRPVASNTMRRAGLAAGVALLVALTAWHQQGRIVDGANALMIRAGVKAQPAPPAPPPPPEARSLLRLRLLPPPPALAGAPRAMLPFG